MNYQIHNHLNMAHKGVLKNAYDGWYIIQDDDFPPIKNYPVHRSTNSFPSSYESVLDGEEVEFELCLDSCGRCKFSSIMTSSHPCKVMCQSPHMAAKIIPSSIRNIKISTLL